MTATATASRLIREYGVTAAAERVGQKVRRWAAWTTPGKPFPLRRLRFWLAVDWQIHHNPAQPC